MGQAFTEAAGVLKPGGMLIATLLDPASAFFRWKQTEPDSYIRKIRHIELPALEAAIAAQGGAKGETFWL